MNAAKQNLRWLIIVALEMGCAGNVRKPKSKKGYISITL